jgi:hypothetical protein
VDARAGPRDRADVGDAERGLAHRQDLGRSRGTPSERSWREIAS